jgi:hypothetical protein
MHKFRILIVMFSFFGWIQNLVRILPSVLFGTRGIFLKKCQVFYPSSQNTSLFVEFWKKRHSKLILSRPISTNNIARGMVRGGRKIRFRSPIIRFRFHNPKRFFHLCTPVRYFSTSPLNYPPQKGIAGARIFATAGSICCRLQAGMLQTGQTWSRHSYPIYPYFLRSAIRPRSVSHRRAPPRCVLRWSSIESAVEK